MTFKNEILNQLKQLGYGKAYIKNVMPEWWDNDALETSGGRLEFAIFLKKRLGLLPSFQNEGGLTFDSNNVHVQFKKRSSTNEEDLQLAASIGWALGSILSCGVAFKPPTEIDPFTLRAHILSLSSSQIVDFESLVDFCWSIGIPVYFLDDLPSGCHRPAGMSLLDEEQPVILLSKRDKNPSVQLFILAHELAHVLLGHISEDSILTDESLLLVEDSLASYSPDQQEKDADTYALNILRGNEVSSSYLMEQLKHNESESSSIAVKALELGSQWKIDSGHLLLSYGFSSKNWLLARQAMGFLEDSTPPRDTLINLFHQYFDISSISAEDYEFLLGNNR